jgi:hypothetical protein
MQGMGHNNWYNLIFDHFILIIIIILFTIKKKMMKKIIILEKQVNEEWIKIWVKGKMIGSFVV